jgi:hypothetical protein
MALEIPLRWRPLQWLSRPSPSTWPRKGGPSGQSWCTFLRNHMPHIAAMDLLVVPTIGFVQLYVWLLSGWLGESYLDQCDCTPDGRMDRAATDGSVPLE